MHEGADEDVTGDSWLDGEHQRHERDHGSSQPDVVIAIMETLETAMETTTDYLARGSMEPGVSIRDRASSRSSSGNASSVKTIFSEILTCIIHRTVTYYMPSTRIVSNPHLALDRQG
jgi:hypothetical protein